MQSVSTRLDDETHAEIEALADEKGTSKSAVIRDLVDKGLQYDDLADERDRLLNELQATNRRVDEHADLVAYVEDKRRRESRREARGSAPVWRRAKWWVFGHPEAAADDGEATT